MSSVMLLLSLSKLINLMEGLKKNNPTGLAQIVVFQKRNQFKVLFQKYSIRCHESGLKECKH